MVSVTVHLTLSRELDSKGVADGFCFPLQGHAQDVSLGG